MIIAMMMIEIRDKNLPHWNHPSTENPLFIVIEEHYRNHLNQKLKMGLLFSVQVPVQFLVKMPQPLFLFSPDRTGESLRTNSALHDRQ